MPMPRKYPKGYYTYVFRDDNDIPIWVGAGKGSRACERRCKQFGVVTIEIIEAKSKEDAFKLEEELIRKYGRLDLGLGTLLNRTNGLGSAGAWTIERRKNASNSAIGRHVWTDEMKAAASLRMTGNTNLLGHTHSQETREKISSKGRGRKLNLTEEERKRRSERITIINKKLKQRKGKTKGAKLCTL